MILLPFLMPVILPIFLGWIGFMIADATGALYGALAGFFIGICVLGVTIRFFLRLNKK